jgi:hypothetical protein
LLSAENGQKAIEGMKICLRAIERSSKKEVIQRRGLFSGPHK